MTFEEILDQALAMLQRRGRMTYRTLQRQFALDDKALADLKDELLYAHPEIRDDAGRGLVWTGAHSLALPATSPPASPQEREPLSYTPPHLAEKILTTRSDLEGERKQVTVLFAALKGSLELIADRDPEEARQILDPVLEHLMAAVHRYEGTVNQVMGDGIMALFGAPVAHEDHAVRACYASAARGLTRFVGRQDELENLRQAQERGGVGHGQVVAAVGEAGVGKSRLVYEFVHSHRTHDWLVLESASVSYGKATPYFPVLDLLKRYAHVEEHDDTRTVRAKVTGQVLTLDDTLQDTVPALLALLDALPEDSPFLRLDPSQRRQRTLVETGVLIGEPGAYRLVQALLTIQVPATVHAVLAARIDRLPPEEKHLLQTAAVIGMEVPLPLLQAIAELPEEALHHGLAHLQAAEFLYETHLFPEPEYTFKHALTHEVAYESLVMTRRQALHAAAGQALEALYGQRLEDAYERLAYHYARTDNVAKAAAYLTRVAEKAARHSAHVEAVSHLTQALELLQRLPATPERSQQELTLHLALGASLIATKGQAAPEVEQTYAHARQLCQYLDDPRQLFPVLRGLWNHALVRAEHQTAHALGEQLLALAQQAQDPAMLVAAHRAMGSTLFCLGVPASAYTHLTQGIALYDPQQHRAAVFRYGEDSGVICHSFAAWALWYLGYPDQGLARIDEAVTMAQQSTHSFSLGFVLSFAAVFHQLRREGHATQERAEAAMSLATEQDFSLWAAYSSIPRAQQARAFELRAATSLARLWQQQGQRHEARQLLAEVYHWCTEGFDTTDLQDAKVLLEALA